MLEIYPTRLLDSNQVHHILSHWSLKPSFVKRKTVRGNSIHYALTGAFFRCCIPRSLHDVVFDLGRRHFGDSMLKVAYNIGEVVPGLPEGPWVSPTGFSCIVPLTELTTVVANHPEVAWLSPGRLFAFCRNERSKELANTASTPRFFLFIHVTSRAPTTPTR
jgi:hypothetical protein